MSALVQLDAGKLFGDDFEVVEPLKHGGMGSVYVVKQLQTGARRALKLMHPQLVQDPKFLKRFEQEARIGAQIPSEHVVQVIAAGVDKVSGTAWLVMELLEGEDLDTCLRRRGQLPQAEATEVLGQLCHALAAAHSVGIVHRDLKPANIFLAVARRRGVPFTVKVLDFGIAKIVAEASTTATEAVGSPMWMAPEQTTQDHEILPATDVWALGLLTFRLLTGRYYWKAPNKPGATTAMLFREILIEPLPSAAQRAAEHGVVGLPKGFDSWFGKCVAREPEARFANAGEAFTMLEKVLATPVRQTQASSPAMDVLVWKDGKDPNKTKRREPEEGGQRGSQRQSIHPDPSPKKVPSSKSELLAPVMDNPPAREKTPAKPALKQAFERKVESTAQKPFNDLDESIQRASRQSDDSSVHRLNRTSSHQDADDGLTAPDTLPAAAARQNMINARVREAAKAKPPEPPEPKEAPKAKPAEPPAKLPEPKEAPKARAAEPPPVPKARPSDPGREMPQARASDPGREAPKPKPSEPTREAPKPKPPELKEAPKTKPVEPPARPSEPKEAPKAKPTDTVSAVLPAKELTAQAVERPPPARPAPSSSLSAPRPASTDPLLAKGSPVGVVAKPSAIAPVTDPGVVETVSGVANTSPDVMFPTRSPSKKLARVVVVGTVVLALLLGAVLGIRNYNEGELKRVCAAEATEGDGRSQRIAACSSLCEAGSPSHCIVQGDLLLPSSPGDKQGKSGAVAAYKAACDLGSKDGCDKISQLTTLLDSTASPVPSAPPTSSAANDIPIDLDAESAPVRHIVVMYSKSQGAPASITRSKAQAQARALEALNKVKAGAKFEDIAREYSDDEGSKSRGGAPDASTMGKLVAMAETLKPGEVVMVLTSIGYHVLLRTSNPLFGTAAAPGDREPLGKKTNDPKDPSDSAGSGTPSQSPTTQPQTQPTSTPPPQPSSQPTTAAGPPDEAAMKRQLEPRVYSGTASLEEMRLLKAICQHLGDMQCKARANQAIQNKTNPAPPP